MPEVRTLQTACRGQLTCSRCATVGHPSTDWPISEPRCVNCSPNPIHQTQNCAKWKTEKEIQIIKTNRNLTYLEEKLIAPQLSQSYAQVTKLDYNHYNTNR
ncbi:hypothetical protein TNCV_3510321 [Trichonephila clavipes]|nr:hypothetical protein TNCV_3510321 [Trichonephila clavipes]